MEYYLKPSVKFEPLIWRWYAWPHLIPPTTAACNIVERHLKIMQSFIENPQIHMEAVKNPKLLGGPFIDLEIERVEEVKDFIKTTKKECETLINLNSHIKEFDQMLQREAQGDSLEAYYQRLPVSLRGFVELVYDVNHRPAIRFIEALLYKTYYSDKSQAIALSEMAGDTRKFVLSTPRLEQADELYFNIPFSDPNLDKLFRMREEPDHFSSIQENLPIPDIKHQLFHSFFTTTAPSLPEDRNYIGEGVRLRYFGHACVLLQTKSVSILFDPVVSYSMQNSSIPRFTLSDLPDHIDYVIITHNHQDHLMFETLLQLKYKIGQIIFPANNSGALQDPSLKLILKHIGFNSLNEMKEMESHSIEGGEIIAIPFLGEHADLNIQTKLSYCVKLGAKNFLFAADSNNLDSVLYDHIFKEIGSIDVLFLGMECDGAPLTWLYGPLLTQPLKRSFDRNRTLSGSNFDKAWLIAEKAKCKKAYVYAMGQEPWLNFIMALKYTEQSPQMIESNKFIQACKNKGIESERLFGKKEWILF